MRNDFGTMPEAGNDRQTTMGEHTSSSDPPLSDSTRQRLRDLRNKLLHLHKALLDGERTAYERLHGRVTSSGEMFQLVIAHEWFAWLRPLSELVVQMDEMLEAYELATTSDAQALIEHARMLLTPSETGNTFGQKYYGTLQREPAVVMAHAEVKRLLKSDV
jgi:hypothetical protein